MSRVSLLSLAMALCLCGACGDDTPTTPTPTEPERFYTTFAGTIGPGEAPFYSFTSGAAGVTDVTLLSLLPAGLATPALTTPLSLSVGTPAGLGCSALTATTVKPALAPQLSVPTAQTIYCVGLADTGSNLTAPAAFTIWIRHP